MSVNSAEEEMQFRRVVFKNPQTWVQKHLYFSKKGDTEIKVLFLIYTDSIIELYYFSVHNIDHKSI